jgi:hypothetical protein
MEYYSIFIDKKAKQSTKAEETDISPEALGTGFTNGLL